MTALPRLKTLCATHEILTCLRSCKPHLPAESSFEGNSMPSHTCTAPSLCFLCCGNLMNLSGCTCFMNWRRTVSSSGISSLATLWYAREVMPCIMAAECGDGMDRRAADPWAKHSRLQLDCNIDIVCACACWWYSLTVKEVRNTPLID